MEAQLESVVRMLAWEKMYKFCTFNPLYTLECRGVMWTVTKDKSKYTLPGSWLARLPLELPGNLGHQQLAIKR